MSDTIDMYRDMKLYRKAERAVYGVNCPKCAQVRPRAHPSILLPGQRCRVDGYRDPREQPSEDERNAAVNAFLAASGATPPTPAQLVSGRTRGAGDQQDRAE